jgi:hypothetical protein
MSNLPTISQIGTDPALVSKLPLDALRAIIETADDAAKAAAYAKKCCTSTIADRLHDGITEAYLAKGVDTGVVHLERDGLDVVVDRSKTVTWDQAALAKAVAEITAAGDDPSEYVKVSYSVSEASYVAWPSMIRRVFEPARTVKPGNPTIKLADMPEAKAA